MVKWLIIAIMFAFCVAGGYLFSMKYKRREQFYHALIMFAQKLDLEINYSREQLKSLILSMDDKTKKNLFSLDKNFLAYLDGKEELSQDKLFSGCKILKNEEKETIFLFFKSLGRSDALGQSKDIQNFIKRFDESLNACSADNKKYGSLCFKLGIIAGLFMVVVLI